MVGNHDTTHHLTYERIYHENLDDLQAVCDPCHEFLSGKRGEDPAHEIAVAADAVSYHILDAMPYLGHLAFALQKLNENELAKVVAKAYITLEEIAKLPEGKFYKLLCEQLESWRLRYAISARLEIVLILCKQKEALCLVFGPFLPFLKDLETVFTWFLT